MKGKENHEISGSNPRRDNKTRWFLSICLSLGEQSYLVSVLVRGSRYLVEQSRCASWPDTTVINKSSLSLKICIPNSVKRTKIIGHWIGIGLNVVTWILRIHIAGQSPAWGWDLVVVVVSYMCFISRLGSSFLSMFWITLIHCNSFRLNWSKAWRLLCLFLEKETVICK